VASRLIIFFGTFDNLCSWIYLRRTEKENMAIRQLEMQKDTQ
jgi:hypothetical protein